MKKYKNQQNVIKKMELNDRFLLFGRTSGIHGLRHIFRENSLSLVRIFWIVTVLVSMFGMYVIIAPLMERGDDVNFTPDTRYLTWTTTFPAVTVCEMFNSRMVQRKLAGLYPDFMQTLDYDMRKYVAELLFGKGTCSKSLCAPCGKAIPCDMPWKDFIDKIHKKCPDLIADCRFNGAPFPCCDTFLPVESDYGDCFSFNTLQSEYSSREKLFKVNLTTGPGLLSFRVLNDSHVSLHSPEELPTDFLDPTFVVDVKTSTEKKIDYFFSAVEMENDPALLKETIAVRQCHYLDELPPLDLYNYKVYSYGACRLTRVTEHKFEHCGCLHPLRHSSRNELHCNFTGLNCLVNTKVEKQLGTHHKEEREDCLPSCVESELTVIHVSKAWVYDDKAGTTVNIRMLSLPTLRYSRNMVRTNLDFVVSVGGIAGLFFGASLLSIVEIFYLVCRSQKKEKISQ